MTVLAPTKPKMLPKLGTDSAINNRASTESVLNKHLFQLNSENRNQILVPTVKLGDKECFNKEQIGVKELFMDYQPFYTINLLLDKEHLPI